MLTRDSNILSGNNDLKENELSGKGKGVESANFLAFLVPEADRLLAIMVRHLEMSHIQQTTAERYEIHH
jgi:hypothetical protein